MFFYMIPNSKKIDRFSEELILPLKDYSIGFDVYFSVNEIIEISKYRSVSVIINKFLHKNDINSIASVLKQLSFVRYFFIEDLGLINFLDKEKIVLNQNHIISNYVSINSYKDLGIENVVISNELTIDEIVTIKKNTSSSLFYFLINRNNLMYSKRKLLSNYYKYKDIHDDGNLKEIEENVSKKVLIIKEEDSGTLIFDKNIFSTNEFLDNLGEINFIVNFSNMNDDEVNIILEHYKDKNLDDYISIDNYFAKNKIGYKVGDLK